MVSEWQICQILSSETYFGRFCVVKIDIFMFFTPYSLVLCNITTLFLHFGTLYICTNLYQCVKQVSPHETLTRGLNSHQSPSIPINTYWAPLKPIKPGGNLHPVQPIGSELKSWRFSGSCTASSFWLKFFPKVMVSLGKNPWNWYPKELLRKMIPMKSWIRHSSFSLFDGNKIVNTQDSWQKHVIQTVNEWESLEIRLYAERAE